jgi:hypothetical protein
MTSIQGFSNYIIDRESGKIISNFGNQIKIHKDKTGRKIIYLINDDNKRIHTTYARIYALAFIPIPNGYELEDLHIDHIDENNSNDNLYNLRWLTKKENVSSNNKSDKRKGRIGSGTHNSLSVPIIAINLETKEEQDFSSVMDAARTLKVQQTNIRNVLKGRRKTAGGYTYKYKQVEEENKDEIFIDVHKSFLNDSVNYIPQVSNLGRIKRKNGSKTKGWETGCGYMRVQIHKKSYRVHRVVAITFLQEEMQKKAIEYGNINLQVNHKNGKKIDNRVENLEWTTPQENTNHAFEMRRNLEEKLLV